MPPAGIKSFSHFLMETQFNQPIQPSSAASNHSTSHVRNKSSHFLCESPFLLANGFPFYNQLLPAATCRFPSNPSAGQASLDNERMKAQTKVVLLKIFRTYLSDFLQPHLCQVFAVFFCDCLFHYHSLHWESNNIYSTSSYKNRFYFAMEWKLRPIKITLNRFLLFAASSF